MVNVQSTIFYTTVLALGVIPSQYPLAYLLPSPRLVHWIGAGWAKTVAAFPRTEFNLISYGWLKFELLPTRWTSAIAYSLRGIGYCPMFVAVSRTILRIARWNSSVLFTALRAGTVNECAAIGHITAFVRAVDRPAKSGDKGLAANRAYVGKLHNGYPFDLGTSTITRWGTGVEARWSAVHEAAISLCNYTTSERRQ